MSDWIDSEGYRANVGIVLMRGTGEVFLGQRTGGRGWQFPQGGVRQGEPVEQALYRELQEEIGIVASAASYVALGSIKQTGGKLVHAWAFAGDWDGKLQSNTFEIEWPPRSGKKRSFPEVDRAGFFSIAEARKKMNPAQVPFLDRLLAELN